MTPVLISNSTLTIIAEPLTPSNFAPFGTAICSPLPRDLNVVPQLSSLPPHDPTPILANQNSALKYSPISPLLNYYPNSCASGKPSSARITMFCCFPRNLRKIHGSQSLERLAFDVRILERHPFTNQTFIPTDLSNHTTVGDGVEEPVFLVVVAPTLRGEIATAKDKTGHSIHIHDPPDLQNMKAFIARGGQAVTYGVGTWHAPMVVLGPRRIDFIVVQHVNGVDEEDCQEVALVEGVAVDLSPNNQHSQAKGPAKLWTSKL